jgi:hypothetical protein
MSRKNNKPSSLLLTLIITMLCISVFTVKPADAIDITQGSPTSDEYPPTIELEMANETPLIANFSQQANQPLNLNLTADAYRSPEGRGHGILNITYNASWLNQQVVLYSWNGNLSSFDDWFKINNSNINPNPNTYLRWNAHSVTPNGTEIYKTNGPPTSVDHHLVINNIPLGHQQINFVVVKAAIYGYGPFSYAEITSSKTIEFSVTNNPTATPTVPELTWLAIMPLLLSIFPVALLVIYRKHNLKPKIKCQETEKETSD